MVEFLPITDSSDDLMRSIFKEKPKRIHALGCQHLEAAAEVKLSDIGEQSAEAFILFGKFLLIFELMSQHAPCPDS